MSQRTVLNPAKRLKQIHHLAFCPGQETVLATSIPMLLRGSRLLVGYRFRGDIDPLGSLFKRAMVKKGPL